MYLIRELALASSGDLLGVDLPHLTKFLPVSAAGIFRINNLGWSWKSVESCDDSLQIRVSSGVLLHTLSPESIRFFRSTFK